jgi:dTDP-glucose 4,6-dehydratase
VRACYRTYGLPISISICSNNYGAFQFPEKLLPLALLRVLAGEPVPLYGDGTNVRDWLSVDDHCMAIEAVLLRGSRGETYNVGGGNQWRNVDAVRLLCAIVDRKFSEEPELRERFPACPAAKGDSTARLLAFVADRPGHDARYALDSEKLRAHAGFAPNVRFEDGLARTVSWYLENEKWWRDIQTGAYRTAPA